MKTATPSSPVRRKARSLILEVIERNILGPVQCLPHQDTLELRRLLREACPWKNGPVYPLRVWREEVRNALGYPVRKPKRYHRPRLRHPREVMPSMRAWAKAQGILAE